MGERRGTKALELWCRRMTEGYPGVKIDNMTTSWRDGLAFCAMIHHFRPDLIEFEKLNKSDVYYNNELAFTTAEKYLGIPALLDAEDMATYEVPDRLSILTYLSQFYQGFAAQNSHNRLKRPSPATEKTQIAKTPGPPSKMAHVVGVPKRDPCQKCQLPVFLAERLIVGKKVYHRTCLKCARCGSQLTPGSFYETEVDDEFCCETCPDEEDLGASGGGLEIATTSSVELRQQETPPPAEATPTTTKSRTVRSSIADRLAFFEQSKVGGDATATTTLNADAKLLLQKNISDEEKSKSIQKKEPPYKMNSAFSSFMQHDTVDAVEDEANSEATSSLATDSLSKQQMDTSDTEAEEELSIEVENRPELPQTQPPPVDEVAPKKTTLQGNEEQQQQKTQKFTATAQLQLSTNNWPEEAAVGEKPSTELQKSHETAAASANNEQSEQIKKIISTKKTEMKLNLTTTTTADDNIHSNSNSNNDAENNKAVELVNLTPKKTITIEDVDDDVKVRKPNDNNYVTKDETIEIDAQPMSTPASNVETINGEAKISDASPLNKRNAAEENVVELRTKPETNDIVEDIETTERLSVVRARLHQFEVIANNVPDINKDNHIKNKDNARNNSNNHKQEVVTTTKNLEDEVKLKAIVEITNHSETETESLNQVPRKDDDDELEVLAKIDNVENKENNMPMELEEDVKQESEEKAKQESEEKANIAEKESREEIIAAPIAALTEVTTETSISNTTPLDSDTSATPNKARQEDPTYPGDLNPFQSDDDDDVELEANKENIRTPRITKPQPQAKLNPFDSSDDEIELEKSGTSTTASTPSASTKVPPPRPPPPRISKNPFGEETDEDLSQLSRRSSMNSSLTRKTPVPTPRTNLSQSQNPTPEPTPRLSNKSAIKSYNASPALQNSSSDDRYGSANSLSTPQSIYRNIELRGSNNSLTSSAGGTIRSRKSRKAPAPPPPSVKELFPSSDTINSSKASTPNSSTVGTPKLGRKKRPAPAPPKPARLDSMLSPHDATQSKNLNSYPLQSELDSKLSDEEKALLEGNRRQLQLELQHDSDVSSISGSKRVIPLDASLLQDDEDNGVGGKSDDVKYKEHEEEINVVYRRVIKPPMLDTPTHDSVSLFDQMNEAHDRQLEKLKDNKEAQNRNRQSQVSASSGAEDSDPTLYNKSSHGKWKRRKGPAPALPVPPRKILLMLPLQEIKHELEIIEVQQQGLEKQGVVLEKMIRDRCEGENGEPLSSAGEVIDAANGKVVTENSKEVEDLILQLFELVNEKNELFRRQAELMYLRRQHRLEQEQADLEYEIRVLMAQPERNKTDSDKAREEALIARMVKVVQLRNEVVECLEMDRLREAEEDMSIKRRLELHTAQREGDEESTKKTLSKLSKKEKKKQKETKKIGKSKKLDADKDADETELNSDKLKIKKKKKKFIF